MIEDEEKDLEEIFERKINWKSVLKGILVFITMLGGYLLVQYSGQQGLGGTGTFLGFMLLCIASSFLVPMDKEKKDVRQSLTKLICENCGRTYIRDYEDGDVLYKKTGHCENCGEKLKITEIYSVKITLDEKKRKTRRNEN